MDVGRGWVWRGKGKWGRDQDTSYCHFVIDKLTDSLAITGLVLCIYPLEVQK